MSFDSELHDSFGVCQNDPEAIDNILDRVFRGEQYTYEDCDDLSQEELDKVFGEPNEQ